MLVRETRMNTNLPNSQTIHVNFIIADLIHAAVTDT